MAQSEPLQNPGHCDSNWSAHDAARWPHRWRGYARRGRAGCDMTKWSHCDGRRTWRTTLS